MLPPLCCGGTPPGIDSQQFVLALKHASEKARKLDTDASGISALIRTSATAPSYSEQLSRIKDDVNDIAAVVRQMNDMRPVAAPWQRTAIARIEPMLTELAQASNQLIGKLNAHPNQLSGKAFRDYVSSYEELASDLAGITSDFANYGEAKARFEAIGRRLELAR